jgi:hypothetical protein
VRAFQFCLPVICIDSTFVTRKYKGQILTSIGMDDVSLLPLCHLFGKDPLVMGQCLLMAWVDRWRPETQTFHLSYGEIAPTLQDVESDLGECFTMVVKHPELGQIQPVGVIYPGYHGPLVTTQNS